MKINSLELETTNATILPKEQYSNCTFNNEYQVEYAYYASHSEQLNP